MKRRHYVSIISIVIAAGLLGAGALVVGQSHVPAQVIASSVTRTPELLERAWRLPVAATFQRKVSWQSNGSRCGPAAVANAYRSLGEAAGTEGKVLAGTGAGPAYASWASRWTSWRRSPGPTPAGELRSYAISVKNNFASICVAPTIPADATS